jgi:hypothetical protein
MANNKNMSMVLLVLSVFAFLYVFWCNCSSSNTSNNRNFSSSNEQELEQFEDSGNVAKSEPLGNNETQGSFEGSSNSPPQCLPKDRLQAKDLLPQNLANSEYGSKFDEVNPLGQGEVDGLNYISSQKHFGINTVGNSNRNANLQLRSEPANPQMNVCPWNKSTIQPDLTRRPLE